MVMGAGLSIWMVGLIILIVASTPVGQITAVIVSWVGGLAMLGGSVLYMRRSL